MHQIDLSIRPLVWSQTRILSEDGTVDLEYYTAMYKCGEISLNQLDHDKIAAWFWNRGQRVQRLPSKSHFRICGPAFPMATVRGRIQRGRSRYVTRRIRDTAPPTPVHHLVRQRFTSCRAMITPRLHRANASNCTQTFPKHSRISFAAALSSTDLGIGGASVSWLPKQPGEPSEPEYQEGFRRESPKVEARDRQTALPRPTGFPSRRRTQPGIDSTRGSTRSLATRSRFSVGRRADRAPRSALDPNPTTRREHERPEASDPHLGRKFYSVPLHEIASASGLQIIVQDGIDAPM